MRRDATGQETNITQRSRRVLWSSIQRGIWWLEWRRSWNGFQCDTVSRDVILGCVSRGMTQRAALGHCCHCSGERAAGADPFGGACENPAEQNRAIQIIQELVKDYIVLRLWYLAERRHRRFWYQVLMTWVSCRYLHRHCWVLRFPSKQNPIVGRSSHVNEGLYTRAEVHKLLLSPIRKSGVLLKDRNWSLLQSH